MHKFRAKPSMVDGQAFPSTLEANVFRIHKMLESSGHIFNLKRQPSVTLREKCPHCGDGPVKWKVDFSYETDGGKLIYVEAKGCETSDYKKKKKIWKQTPPARLEIWKGTHNPRCVEVIE